MQTQTPLRASPTILHLGLCLILSASAKAQDLKPSAPRVASHIKAEALWDGRKMMPFKALDFPRMVKASEAAFMREGDYLLGITVPGQSRAYPTRFIWFHHVINDKVRDAAGKEFAFAVTYCSVCNTGIGYDSSLNGKPVMLDFYGLYNGVVALCERESQSVLPQVSGEFVTGALMGSNLSAYPVLDTTWAKWKQLHPDTLVMSDDTPFSKSYRPSDRPEPRGYTNFPAPFFRPSVTRGDLRLPPFEKVLGVTVRSNGALLYRAYPIKSLADASGVINDSIGDTRISVLFDTTSQSANAVLPKVDGKNLTLVARKGDDGAAAFFDVETGTRWSLDGRADSGKLEGKSLATIENHLSQWYGWAAFFPATSIYGRADAPQPGSPFDTPAGDAPKP